MNEINRGKWLDFVAGHDYGSFFHTPEAFSLYQTLGEAGVIAMLDEAGDVHGVCVYFRQRFGPSFLGKLFTRTIVYGNIPVSNRSIDLTGTILESLNTKSKNSVYIEIRNLQPSQENDIYNLQGFLYKPHLNIVNHLESTQAELFEKLTSSRQRGVKKAMKFNFSFDCLQEPSEELLLNGYELIKSTYHRIKLPYPGIESFQFINTGLPGESRLFFTLKDENEELCAFLVGFVFRKSFYGYYMGSKTDSEFLNKRPLDLFYWEIIKSLNEKGFQKFDWMGAGAPDEDYGVRDFKKQYGGELIETGRYVRINKPFRYRLIFGILKKLYRIFGS